MLNPVMATKNDWNWFKPICVGNFENVRIGKQIILNIDKLDKSDVFQAADQMCQKILANTVIENYKIEILEDN